MDQSARRASGPAGRGVAGSSDLQASHYSLAGEDAGSSGEIEEEKSGSYRVCRQACRTSLTLMRLYALSFHIEASRCVSALRRSSVFGGKCGVAETMP